MNSLTRACRVTATRWAILPVMLVASACGVPAVSIEPSRPAPSLADAEFPGLEHRALVLINDHREANGVAPLAFDSGVAAIARGYARERATGDAGAPSVTRQRRRERTVCRVTPFREIAEHYAVMSGDSITAADAAAWSWVNGPATSAALLEDFDATGIGVVRDEGGSYHFVQILIRRSRDPAALRRCY